MTRSSDEPGLSEQRTAAEARERRDIVTGEVMDEAQRARLWTLAVAAYPPYAEYQARTKRQIPVFVAEP